MVAFFILENKNSGNEVKGKGCEMFEFIDGPICQSILEALWFIAGTFGLLHLVEKIQRRLMIRRLRRNERWN